MKAAAAAVALMLSLGASGVRAPEVEQVYDRPLGVSFGGAGVVRPWPVLGIGLGVSGVTRRGEALSSATLEPTGDEARLVLVTTVLRVEGRVEVAEHQPVVPYLAGGPLITWYTETVAGEAIHGAKPGAWIGGGVAILITPETTWSVLPGPGLHGIYLRAEGVHRWARWCSGTGLDLGGWQLDGGVTIVVR